MVQSSTSVKMVQVTVMYHNSNNTITIISPTGKSITFKPVYLRVPQHLIQFYCNCQQRYNLVEYTMQPTVTFTAQLTTSILQELLNIATAQNS
jgi:hypothetical protein